MDAAEWTTKAYRYLGIGISDFAHFLAKNEARLGTVKAKELTHKWAERFQYGLIKASNELAIERGACEAFWNDSEYAKGKLPIDTYNKNVDAIVDNNLLCDWESLRASVAEHGMRNMALSAIPPTASSSIVSNSTQGIDPIQSMTDTFESSAYTVRSLVPDSDKEKYYMKAWDFPDNTSAEYIKLMAVIQKFIDQGMSVNQWYDLTKIPEIINRLKSLTRLILRSNKLSVLPKSIGNLFSLEFLDLDDTLLTSLPESIGKLSSLKSLSIRKNPLKTLPTSIGNLIKLDSLLHI